MKTNQNQLAPIVLGELDGAIVLRGNKEADIECYIPTIQGNAEKDSDVVLLVGMLMWMLNSPRAAADLNQVMGKFCQEIDRLRRKDAPHAAH